MYFLTSTVCSRRVCITDNYYCARGPPMVARRGVIDAQDSGPSLLFWDLPNPPLSAGDPGPEMFRSNILLSVLERMQAQDLPRLWCKVSHGIIWPHE